jgi:NTE family protein
VQIGDEPALFTEIYQPLDPRLRYFVSGGIGFESTSVRIFDESGNNLARFQLNLYGVELGAGREFGTWGEGRVGYRRGSGHAEVSIGPPMPDVDLDRGEVFVRLADDKLDNLNFPRAGHYGRLEWNVARKTLGARRNYDQLQLNYQHAFPRGRNSILAGVYAATTFDDDAPIEGLFSLGGLFRLSGLEENQLFGQHAGLLTIGYLRSLQPAGLLQPYVGATLEAGNVWQRRSDISLDNSIISGSVFFGMDTLFGPIYLAYGHSDTGESAIYIRLGPRLAF